MSDEITLREHLRRIGSMSTPAKTAAARRNAIKRLSDIPCICGARRPHYSRCLRGQAEKRRETNDR